MGGTGLVQAYFMLDEMLIAGELQEPSKKVHLSMLHLCSHGVQIKKLDMWQVLQLAPQSLSLLLAAESCACSFISA